MRRIILTVVSFAMILSCLCGCGAAQNADSLDIVCTVFPVYDWMRQLTNGADGVELTLIADNGVDMHSYQPTTGDIVDIATCDLFVFIGGESEEWVEEVLAESAGEDNTVVKLLDTLGDSAIEMSDHDHHEHSHDHECVYDEHIWLSPMRASVLCEQLCERLCELDEENAELYRSNLVEYTARLLALDESYRQAAESAQTDTLLFADRFPFRYLTADYGIAYHAAFDGCSAETEASFDTIANLSAAADEHGVNCLLIIEGSDDSLARTIIDGTISGDQTILTLNSLQSITAADIESGVTYLSVMEENLEVLRQALGCE